MKIVFKFTTHSHLIMTNYPHFLWKESSESQDTEIDPRPLRVCLYFAFCAFHLRAHVQTHPCETFDVERRARIRLYYCVKCWVREWAGVDLWNCLIGPLIMGCYYCHWCVGVCVCQVLMHAFPVCPVAIIASQSYPKHSRRRIHYKCDWSYLGSSFMAI